MKTGVTREQIIADILLQYKLPDEKIDKTDSYKTLADEQGQAFVDRPVTEQDGHSEVIRAELQKRLTEETYLTCEDFDHFDVTCCELCHAYYPHYDMYVVLLSDGRSAWVCDSTTAILMRQTKLVPPSSDQEGSFTLLDDLFASTPDPIGDAMHEACMAASFDKEKLYYCLKYAHHTYGRRRGDETVESLVTRALVLPGRGPAQSSKTA